jgi:hypothetical protein
MEKKEAKQQQHHSESITFRLDSIILNKLHREADQKEISVNTLVGHIVRRHVDWHSNAAKAGFITVRRGLLIDLISRLPDKEISSIAEYIAKNETKDFVLLLRNEYNIESALDVIETWIKISGYPYRHEANYTRHSAIRAFVIIVFVINLLVHRQSIYYYDQIWFYAAAVSYLLIAVLVLCFLNSSYSA